MNARSRKLVLGLSSLSLWAACSSDQEPESVGETQQRADLLACPTPQFGMACDPDGNTAVLGPCEGLCGFDETSPSGKIVCIPIVDLGLLNLDDRLCIGRSRRKIDEAFECVEIHSQTVIAQESGPETCPVDDPLPDTT